MKNSNYTFRCNEDIKEEFKMLCKIGNVSPSDILTACMLEFNETARRIMEMEDISQLRDMFQEKVAHANNEMDKIMKHEYFND